MKSITFDVCGLPKGQPRARAFAVKMGSKFTARMYDPSTAEGWKGCIAAAVKPHLPEVPTELPVTLCLDFRMPRPKAHYTKKGLRPTAPEYFTGKPDADNLAKAVMDALTMLGMWKDDKQISELRVTKKYGTPGAMITVQY